MRRRPIDLTQHGISDERCQELMFFCLQYNQKKQKIADIIDSVPGALSGSISSSGIGNPTLSKVLKMQQYIKECETIEQAAIQAIGHHEDELCSHLLTNVTQMKPPPISSIPCGKNQFYRYRRMFYVYLDKMRDSGTVDL